MTIHVVETFKSIQGEGPLAGMPTFFVRLWGCDKKCDGWPCDTPQALQWSGEKTPKPMTTHRLTGLIVESKQNWVCWTGGEPTLKTDAIASVLHQLCAHEHEHDFSYRRKHTLETHGENFAALVHLSRLVDRIVISPKLHSSGDPFKFSSPEHYVPMVLGKCFRSKITFKFVVGSYEDLKQLLPWYEVLSDHNVYVQPVDGEGFFTFKELYTRMSIAFPGHQWRLMPQLNKTVSMP